MSNRCFFASMHSLHCKAVRDILELQMQSVGNVSHTFLDLVILMVPCNGSNEVLCSFFALNGKGGERRRIF